MRKKLLALVLILFCCPILTLSQGSVEDTVRINTRAVFVSALVRDRKTGQPVTDLVREDFEVLDNGSPRALSYFSNEGTARRPLALVLVLNLSTGAILYLEKSEVMGQIISALSKLQPEDEVAVMQTWYEPGPTPLSFQLRSKMVEGLTRDRARTSAALRGVQQFAKQNLPQVKIFFSMKSLFKAGLKAGLMNPDPQAAPISITMAPDFENIIERAPSMAANERPDSQLVIANISDDLEADFRGRSSTIARKLNTSGVIVSSIVVKRDFIGGAANLLGEMLSPVMGMRMHTISYFARETGGEAVTADSPQKFSEAISRIVGGLAARYSLGFTLSEQESANAGMHRLEVRIKSTNAQNRKRKLAVTARRGYYLTGATPNQSISQQAQ